jgi:hypothetical protein
MTDLKEYDELTAKLLAEARQQDNLCREAITRGDLEEARTYHQAEEKLRARLRRRAAHRRLLAGDKHPLVEHRKTQAGS